MPRITHLLRLTTLAMSLSAFVVTAQPYVPGQTYYGRSNYIEYIAGELPIILSAPHGGGLTPGEIPNRTNCTTCGWNFETVTDSNTDDLARKLRTEIQNLTGYHSSNSSGSASKLSDKRCLDRCWRIMQSGKNLKGKCE